MIDSKSDYVDYYLLLIGGLNVLLCKTDDLFRYDFSGRQLFRMSDFSDLRGFREAIKKSISQFKIKFLLVSVDPFILTPMHEELLMNLEVSIGAIVCDTHHGIKPLSRILEFCINANVRSILLQFNQRHRVFFERLFMPVSCSFFSPDLYNFISNAQLPSMARSQHELITQRESRMSNTRGVFVGSVSDVHRYRQYLLKKVCAMGIQLDILRAPNPLSMIGLMSNYSWALNLPLNGDFNRRFVECFLSSTCMISESIPSSQLFFPYSLFKNSIIFFRDPSEIPGLLRASRDRIENYARLNFKRCLDLYETNYEIIVLQDFIKPLIARDSDTSVKQKATPSEIRNVLEQASVYEDLLAASLYADQLTSQEKNELQGKGSQFLGDLYDVENEFHRLYQ